MTHDSRGSSRIAELKRAAAEAAVELVTDGMIVGLGTGSTAAFAVEALALRMRQGLRFQGLATSERTAAQATSLGIPLTSFAEHREIDLTIDGADEVERETLNLIKGLGGALLREKIVAAASRQLVIIVDESKLVERLGSQAPLPVEVVPFGREATQDELESLGSAGSDLRTPASATAGPAVHPRLDPSGQLFVTDGGNHILDCSFGPLADPARLEERIKRIVGVVESGLFIGRTTVVFAAFADHVKRFDSVVPGS